MTAYHLVELLTVAAAVAASALFVARHFRPRRRPAPAACAGCSSRAGCAGPVRPA